MSPDAPPGIRVAIELERLTVRYGPVVAVRDVSLAIPPCRITAVVGPSGSGKSSLLAAINRLVDLVPGAVVSGRVRIAGQEIYNGLTDVDELRRRVAMVFQRPNPFPMSVRRNITLALREHGVRRRELLEAIVHRVLHDVGLWEEVGGRLDYPAHKLSGGQQQRLCIARAMALDPEVLLLDEPCSALDPLSTAKIEELLRRFRERYTVVLVTHNLAQARRLADYVAVLWQIEGEGRLLEFGPASDVFENPQHELTRAYVTGLTG
ncbi:MAG: phosphate import ATP-binding protein PstB [Pirellulaceae bacterium]|nr:MAG: phosphate import ATP-binding protein PstB [Pirellulaceae bacterium]